MVADARGTSIPRPHYIEDQSRGISGKCEAALPARYEFDTFCRINCNHKCAPCPLFGSRDWVSSVGGSARRHFLTTFPASQDPADSAGSKKRGFEKKVVDLEVTAARVVRPGLGPAETELSGEAQRTESEKPVILK